MCVQPSVSATNQMVWARYRIRRVRFLFTVALPPQHRSGQSEGHAENRTDTRIDHCRTAVEAKHKSSSNQAQMVAAARCSRDRCRFSRSAPKPAFNWSMSRLAKARSPDPGGFFCSITLGARTDALGLGRALSSSERAPKLIDKYPPGSGRGRRRTSLRQT